MMQPQQLKGYLNELGGYNRPTIHIAGSKGKGTTTSLLAELLRKKSKRVGRFISPFILDEKECFVVNGKEISEEDFKRLRLSMSEDLSPFEQRTLMALRYFQEQECDYVVLETGWGGRDDATNVVESKILTILTHIELEHIHTLGPTLEIITEKKLGIARPGVPMITSPSQDPIIHKLMDELGIDAVHAEDKNLGYHHPEAVGLVLKAMELLGHEVTDEELDELSSYTIPGRFEVIPFGIHELILDGAHTPHSVKYVKNRIQDYQKESGYSSLHWCVHFLKDKSEELTGFFPHDNSTWISIDDPRAGLNPTGFAQKEVKEILETIMKDDEAKIFAFLGSFKLVAAIKRALS